jgi:hypothetical protein
MASGHVNRANRPNTWPLRPTPQSEDSTCQPGAVHTWGPWRTSIELGNVSYWLLNRLRLMVKRAR